MVYATALVCLWLFGRFATVPQLVFNCGKQLRQTCHSQLPQSGYVFTYTPTVALRHARLKPWQDRLWRINCGKRGPNEKQ